MTEQEVITSIYDGLRLAYEAQSDRTLSDYISQREEMMYENKAFDYTTRVHTHESRKTIEDDDDDDVIF